MKNDFTVSHEDVTVFYHSNWAGHSFNVTLKDVHTNNFFRDTLEESMKEFRKKTLPETGDEFTGCLKGMFAELSPVFREGVIPSTFSVWKQDFPDGPMGVAVKAVKDTRLNVTFTWDFSNKPVHSYDMYLLGTDLEAAFLAEADKVIEKYRAAVDLWKDWTDESLEIAAAAMKRLLEKENAKI